MCFPSLPIGPFMNWLPGLFLQSFFDGSLFFLCRSHQLEKQWCHAILKMLVFPERSVAGATSNVCGEEEIEESGFASIQLSLPLFRWSSITVPCTPQVWIAKPILSCNHILTYPVILYPEPLLLIFSRPVWGITVAVWQMNMKKKKTKHCNSSDPSQNSHAWGNFLCQIKE